jgi:two-component system cell cycle response regulator
VEHSVPGKSVILIVDDAPYARETLASLLTAPEYQLAFASDGHEAISLAERLIPDLVLLDVMMPGMNGFEVCRAIRKHTRLAEVPIILVTALDDRDSLLEGLDAGADDFVTKPIDRAELRVRVRTVTRLNRYRRLHNQRARFEWVVEQADDGYLIIGERGELLYANASAGRLLELPERIDPATNLLLMTQIRPRFRFEPAEVWHRWLNEGVRPPPYRLYLVRPETETAAALWLEVKVLAQADRLGLEQLVHVRDVTAQVVAQRDSWSFHAMIMHKLNTPLQTILGGLELILPDSSQQLPPEEVAMLVRLSHLGAQRLSAAVEDILRFLGAPVIAHNGDGMRVGVLPLTVAQIGAALGVTTATHVEESLMDERLRLTARALEAILWELLENARKFHPEQSPQVGVTVANHSPSEVVLRVMDNGRWLLPEQLHKLWLPYYQAEKHFTGEMPGMGLGLATVAMLVWEAGGDCQIRNREDGPGVLVELILPKLAA